MHHYVYRITNTVNGKQYIGQHSSEKSFHEDYYYGSGTLILKALKKYGRSNFTKEIIGEYDTKEEALEVEFDEIEKAKAYDNPNYYNISKGGQKGAVNRRSRIHLKDEPIIPMYDYYLKQLETDFESALGGTDFKMKYYMGYYILNGYDKSYIYDRMEYITKAYFKSARYDFDIMFDGIYEDLTKEDVSSLIEIYQNKYISIYDSEIAYIDSLPKIFTSDTNRSVSYLQKIIIGCLLLYKVYANEYGEKIKLKLTDLKKYCHISNDKSKVIVLLNKLNDYGCIEYDGEYFSIPFCCFDENAKLYDTILFTDTAFLFFDMYKGADIIKCGMCGALVKNNKCHTKKYCNVHNKYIKTGIHECTCADCGKVFFVRSMANNKHRCDGCQCEYRKIVSRESTRRIRQAKRMAEAVAV